MGTLGEDSRLLRYLAGGLTPAERQQVECQLDGSPTDRLVVAELARVYGMGWDAGSAVTIDEGHGGEPEDAFPVPERYELRERLGEGGMGVVFGAHDRHLDRPVAIKRLHDVERTVEGRARLRREAQALAQLSHPNIVQIYDVGDEGRLYLAMEWVVGLTLEEWRKAAPRTLDELMAMYLQAGEGLAAAHAHGIVHRDFKPSNALVGADGRVRVVDFGLARQWVSRVHDPITAPEREEVRSERSGHDGLVAVTEAGLVVGTPAYMAPEQAYGREPEPACDQFSFCVALCEALYGQRPRVIASEPTPARERLAAIAERSTTGISVPARIRAALERGLDEEPQRRWPSMRALLDELRSSIGGRRRRTWGVLAVGGLVGSAVLGLQLVGLPAEVDGCEGGAAKLAEAWGDEQRAALRARGGDAEAIEAIEALASRLDAHADAWSEAYRAVCREGTEEEGAQARLDLRMQCLEQQRRGLGASVRVLLEGSPELLAKGAAAVDALPSAQICAERTEDDVMLPTEPDRLEAARRLLDALDQVDVLWAGGQRPQALQLARRLIIDAEALAHPPLLAATELRLGRALASAGRYADAREPLEHAFFEARAAGAHEVAAQAIAALIPVLRRLAPGHEEVDRFIEQLCAMAETSGDADARAQCHVHRGYTSLERAESEQALAHVEPVLQQPAPSRVTRARSDALLVRAQALMHLGRLQEAEATLDELLAAERARVGPGGQGELEARAQLAMVRVRHGQYAQAQQEMLAVLVPLARMLGPEHPNVGRVVAHLALALEGLGRDDEALVYHERALTIFERTQGPSHSYVARVLGNLGQLYMRKGDGKRALLYLERGLQAATEIYGEDHPMVAQYHMVLGSALELEARTDEAASHIERALRGLETTLGPDHIRVAEACSALGPVVAALGRVDEGEALLRRSLRIRITHDQVEHPSTAQTHVSLARLLLDERQRPEEAYGELQRALSIYEAKLGPDNTQLRTALYQLSVAEHALGQHAAAAEHARRSLDLYVAHGSLRYVPRGRLALARALWDGRLDRSQALAEAEAARVGYAELDDADGVAAAQALLRRR